MRKFLMGIALLAAMVGIAGAQPVVQPNLAESIAGFSTNNTTGSTCALIKYVGSTAGKPTVEVDAPGDMTFKIAGSVDTTTGWVTSASSLGVFDLSTPDATIDTYGELVNIVNTTGSNWRMVLVSCLASDLTNNTITTFSATDAAGPAGVALTRDAAVASATSVFSAQVAAVPVDAATNIQFWLNSGGAGYPASGKKINPNPFANWQAFIQHVRENITSSGTVALQEILAVKRVYDGNGKVSEQVRTLWSVTGAASTSEAIYNFHPGPVMAAPGEMIIMRQRTGTALTVQSIGVSGYMVRR